MFDLFFYKPVLNLVIFIYNILPWADVGLAIIIFTVILRMALWQLSAKTIEAQKKLQTLQPELNKIKEECKDNKEEMARATMAFYKEKKVSPFSACLPVLIQLPFLFAVFKVFRQDLAEQTTNLYSFIPTPESINHVFLGIVDLSTPIPAIALLAAAAQFWQTKHIMNRNKVSHSGHTNQQELAEVMGKQMLYLMPAMTFFIGLTFPGGLSLYWLVATIMAIAQQYWIFKGVVVK